MQEYQYVKKYGSLVQEMIDDIRKKSVYYIGPNCIILIEELCKKIARSNGCKGNDTVFRFSIYCTSDNYGRTLFYAYGLHRDVKGEGISPKSETMYFDMAFIFGPGGANGSAIRLKDMYNYQDDLREFKRSNNWDRPF